MSPTDEIPDDELLIRRVPPGETWQKLPGPVPTSVNVRLRVSGTDRTVTVSSVLGHNPQAGVWELVTIPMSRFGVSSGSISQMHFDSPSTSPTPRVLIDELALDMV